MTPPFTLPVPLPPHSTHTQATLPTSTVLSHSPTDKATVKDAKVAWEGLGKAEPWAEAPLKLHFAHDKPFKLVRFFVCLCVCVGRWGLMDGLLVGGWVGGWVDAGCVCGLRVD